MNHQFCRLTFESVCQGVEVWRLEQESVPGRLWAHRVEIAHPASGSTELAVLEVSGDWAGEVDTEFTRQLCLASGLTTVSLYGIPNQPGIGLREDDLIADSFVRVLDGQEQTLLDQMTGAVRAAMDSVGVVIDCSGWVLTGASKRGWTVWLLGQSGDERVKGIAPRVFDGIRFDWQLARQIETWGEANFAVGPYLGRGLGAAFSEEGSALLQRVDPYGGLGQVKCPVLVISGGADEFWHPAALEGWWDEVPEPKELLRLPDHGHDLKPCEAWLPALGRFASGLRQPD